jgi:hypothetical protein
VEEAADTWENRFNDLAENCRIGGYRLHDEPLDQHQCRLKKAAQPNIDRIAEKYTLFIGAPDAARPDHS